MLGAVVIGKLRRAILRTILYSTIFSVTPRHNFTDRFAHLTLITQELKTRYSPETQKLLLEESSQFLPDFVLQARIIKAPRAGSKR
ncbi:hypothetical protein GXM_09771 [Nostoc sphaeroides CCNUC1]|uniref:Uncharacterized protein n=1 Tax=Nostoc sphaeroides CCNUC1 TaxID=2653204 RepID=A0A5P8WHD8_9NOSO|nr:hypothetical protein GXM_09771 [Nostoc sphaeroides CCNUC1]